MYNYYKEFCVGESKAETASAIFPIYVCNTARCEQVLYETVTEPDEADIYVYNDLHHPVTSHHRRTAYVYNS